MARMVTLIVHCKLQVAIERKTSRRREQRVSFSQISLSTFNLQDAQGIIYFTHFVDASSLVFSILPLPEERGESLYTKSHVIKLQPWQFR